jgi:hypothetical protein
VCRGKGGRDQRKATKEKELKIKNNKIKEFYW